MKGQISVGSRVIVPLIEKFYTAIVIGTPNLPPEGFEIKDVAMVLRLLSVVRHPQVKLWQWMLIIIFAHWVMFTGLQCSRLEIESETFVEINPDYDFAESPVSEQREAEYASSLITQEACRLGALSAKLTFLRVPSLVNAMIDRGVLIISEKLVERYRVRYEPYVTLIPSTLSIFKRLSAWLKVRKNRKPFCWRCLSFPGCSWQCC